MKKVEAFLKDHMLDEVVHQLHGIQGLTGMTITGGQGCGRDRPDQPRISPEDLHSVVRIEVFCLDTLAATVVDVIAKAAHTGLRGDGKVYVIPVEEAVRISSGERGEPAV